MLVECCSWRRGGEATCPRRTPLPPLLPLLGGWDAMGSGRCGLLMVVWGGERCGVCGCMCWFWFGPEARSGEAADEVAAVVMRRGACGTRDGITHTISKPSRKCRGAQNRLDNPNVSPGRCRPPSPLAFSRHTRRLLASPQQAKAPQSDDEGAAHVDFNGWRIRGGGVETRDPKSGPTE